MQAHAVTMHVHGISDLLIMAQQSSSVCQCISVCTDIYPEMQLDLWQKQSDWGVLPPKFPKAAGMLAQIQISTVGCCIKA